MDRANAGLRNACGAYDTAPTAPSLPARRRFTRSPASPPIHPPSPGVITMPSYTPPLRDMQFVLHELLNVTNELKMLPRTPTSTPTPSTPCWKRRQVCRRGDRAAQHQRRHRRLQAGPRTHEVTTPKGFKEAYKTSMWKAAGRR
jgi:hypothetical protein